MPAPHYPGPISSNILDDFQAPAEATKPLQDQLVRIRQAFAALDGRWIRVKDMLRTLDLTNEEVATMVAYEQASTDLNYAILNRPADIRPDEAPAKGVQHTY